MVQGISSHAQISRTRGFAREGCLARQRQERKRLNIKLSFRKKPEEDKMISELQDAINIADATDNQKVKNILLKIAALKEDKQKTVLEIVKLMIMKGDE
jgi:hypothetical protein